MPVCGRETLLPGLVGAITEYGNGPTAQCVVLKSGTLLAITPCSKQALGCFLGPAMQKSGGGGVSTFTGRVSISTASREFFWRAVGAVCRKDYGVVILSTILLI